MLKYNSIDKCMFNREIEEAYKSKWKPLIKNPNLIFFKLYSSIHGKIDFNYIPDDYYEFPLNNYLQNTRYTFACEDKNSFEKRLPEFKHFFPQVFFRKIFGKYYDYNYNYIDNIDDFIRKLNTDKFVLKESIDTAGGKGVSFFNRIQNGQFVSKKGENVHNLVSQLSDFVAQERIEQNKEMKKLNESSLNSVRVVTYRSAYSNDVHVLRSLVRCGGEGSLVDNWHSGGSLFNIESDGKLASFGYDSIFRRVDNPALGMNVPYLEEIYGIAKQIGKKELYHRQLAFDFCINSMDEVKLIEINYSAAPWLQIVWGPAFNKFTDEVIETYSKASGSVIISVPLSNQSKASK